MELSQYGELFLSESREHVSAINQYLLALEKDTGSREAVDRLFRSVHTIKGMSATMGYRAVADLTHEMENLLDRVRQGRVTPDASILDLLFTSTDVLESAIEAAVAEGDDDNTAVSELMERLREAAGDEREFDLYAPQVMLEPAPSTVAAAATPAPAAPMDSGVLHVHVRVSPDSMLAGVRAFLALRRARELGTVDAVTPPEGALQEEGFDGHMNLVLRTERSPMDIRDALMAVGELAEVDVQHPRLVVDHAPAGIPGAEPSTEAQAATGVGKVRNIRVDLRRLDALMNGVGELVIVRDRLRSLAGGSTPELQESVDQASRLVAELQDEIMRARMAPVGQVFDRFPRLVRDAARQLGKRVEFVMLGQEIELDRSMLDEIGDPLVHLLRNSLDHGIEPPAERRAAGKPEAGTLRLTAARERSRIVIRVEDDGRGIQRERVLRKAVSQGLITSEEADAATEEEVNRLLLRPGFSTAETITDVSGRGVGLDVVASRVRALGGMLEIHSTPGAGTAMTLQLPQTLAIVRALLVRQGGQTYALPLTHVGETIHLLAEDVGQVKGKPVAFVREEVIPLLPLHDILRQPRSDPGAKRHAVVLEVGEQRVGLEVDALLGQQEVVVKGFDATTDTLRLFSGATILSDGRPALILDAGSLLTAA